MDSEIVQPIIEGLTVRGIDLVSVTEFAFGLPNVLSTIRAADAYVLVLTERSIQSPAVLAEIAAFKEPGGLRDRGVLISIVGMDATPLPTDLASYQAFDLREGFDNGLDILANRLMTVGRIEFSQLSPVQFERLVGELLTAMGFDVEWTSGPDAGFDFRATYRGRDPLDAPTLSTWLVQVKHYKAGRASVSTLSGFESMAAKSPAHERCLVVTSGLLTSIARDFIENHATISGSFLRVIDGSKLSSLLLKYPEVAERYRTSDTLP